MEHMARYTPMEGHITDADGKFAVSEQVCSLAIPIAEDAVYLEGEQAIDLNRLSE